MKNQKRNIELSFTATEIDIISEALTTVTGSPKDGVPALLLRIDEVSGMNGSTVPGVSNEELSEYEETGKRTHRMRRHLNRKRYLKASGQEDTTAAQWADLLLGGVKP